MDMPFQESLREAMFAALRRADGSDRTQIFVEDRLHVRMGLSSRGGTERTRLRIVGVALDGSSAVHVSDPGISSLARGEPLPGEDSLSRVLPEPDLPIEELRPLLEVVLAGGISARLVASHQNIWVARPGGEFHEDVRSGFRLELQSEDDAGVTIDVAFDPAHAPSSSALAARLRERVNERRHAVSLAPPDGSALVLAPGVAGIVIHELVGHALEADAAAEGSRLAAFRGRVASESIRVIDDPALSRVSWAIDDEGVAPRAVTLLEGGRITGRLSDRACARAVATTPTGHGRRGSFLDPVLPRMGCTFIDRGSASASEILESTKRGVYVRRLAAAHTDVRAGRATFAVTDADRIENGRITRPLLPFAIQLDAIDALSSVDHVADDLAFDTCIGSCVREGQPLSVSVGAPTVRIGVVTVIV